MQRDAIKAHSTHAIAMPFISGKEPIRLLICDPVRIAIFMSSISQDCVLQTHPLVKLETYLVVYKFVKDLE